MTTAWQADDPWLIVGIDYGTGPSFFEVSWVQHPSDDGRFIDPVVLRRSLVDYGRF